MMRRPRAAIGATAGSLVNCATTPSAHTMNTRLIIPRTTELYRHARHTDAARRRRRHGRAGDGQPGAWSQTEDEARIETDVDRVGDPEDTHRDRRVARAAEHRVDQKQHHDDAVEAENDGRVR